MAAEHSAVLQLGLVEATRRGWRFFKNVVGSAWVGKLSNQWNDSKAGKCVELSNAHFQPFGLLVPSSTDGKTHGGGLDAIGWQTIRVTPDMIGMRLAIFAVADAKTESYSKMSKDQKNFVREVLKAGGIALIIRRSSDGETVDFYEAGPEDHHGKA